MLPLLLLLLLLIIHFICNAPFSNSESKIIIKISNNVIKISRLKCFTNAGKKIPMFLFKSYKKRSSLNQRPLWEWFIKSCSQHQINTIKVLFIFNSCFPFLKKCFDVFFISWYCALHPKIQCEKAVVNKAQCVNMYLLFIQEQYQIHEEMIC